jgi:hypothetical protein
VLWISKAWKPCHQQAPQVMFCEMPSKRQKVPRTFEQKKRIDPSDTANSAIEDSKETL